MDKALDPNTGDYTGKVINDLSNAVYIRLITPLGSYWADPKLGSLLHTLQREKDLPTISMFARQYAEEALQPIIDDGRAETIHITSTQPHNGILILDIQVMTAHDENFTYAFPVKVI